eukprot:GFKZ01001545.1.p1 GENE.GFKZ01001545.1~~GFKZ01001545.1.p1  ORF type:complete len:348 (-),score=50.31 GFKZ01001545.1:2683-3726(-)
MAFVNPLPLGICSNAGPLLSSLTRPTKPQIITRQKRATVLMSDNSATAPTLQRVYNERDIRAAYAVWDAVADEEGRPRAKRDERDDAATTVHVVARSHEGRVIGAGRLLRVGQNARLDRVSVLSKYRGKGVGRKLVERLLVMAAPVQGAIFVNAMRGGEMGFFSIMGFESLGNDRLEDGVMVRTMIYRVPVCAPSIGCVGLHHTSIRVVDIERSLAFYGSLGFVVTDKFLTSGGRRACYVEGLGTRLEFVESPDGSGGLAGVQGIPPAGFDRLVFDVTKACTDLDLYLQHLERRNGGILNVVGMPAKQIVGAVVVSVATIEDPDGLPIEFIKQEAQVPGELRTRVDW